MTTVLRSISCACALILLAGGAGCGGGKSYRVGRKAEERGDAHVAYDNYRRAARRHPGSSAITAALKRTGPAAAAFWESKASAAQEEGRLADAWRMWMRTLEICPDHAEALLSIRRLEGRRSQEVAAARTDWLRRGAVALVAGEMGVAVAKADVGEPAEGLQAGEGRVAGPASEPGRVADGPAVVAARAPPSPVSLASRPPVPEREEPSEAASESQIALAMVPRQPKVVTDRPVRTQPPAVAAAPTPDPKPAEPGQQPAPMVAETSDGMGKPDDPTPAPSSPGPSPPPAVKSQVTADGKSESRTGLSSAINKAITEAMPKTRKPKRPPPRTEAAPTVRQRPKKRLPRLPNHSRPSQPMKRMADSAREPAAPGQADEFLIILTLSKKDRRYPRQTRVLDGIIIKLKDTDGDQDADLSLYDGKRRIKKIRELPIGHSRTFHSRSGKRYRLTILSVHHKTRTVRFGLKPA